LEAAGAKAMRDADPVPYTDDGAPSLEELEASQAVADKELEAMRRVFEADDKLAEALAIVKQRDSLIEQLQWRINGLVNENAELISSVKSWRRKAEKKAA
jgi:pantothenate kinase-related protein Tda10